MRSRAGWDTIGFTLTLALSLKGEGIARLLCGDLAPNDNHELSTMNQKIEVYDNDFS
jgi:hypothetical protein